MYLIAGLGNPGKEYTHTRHNAGFLAIEALHAAFATDWHLSDWYDAHKEHAHVADGRAKKERVMLVKPQTFMNRSGQTIAALLNWHKCTPDHLIVLHDDLDIPLGEMRVQFDRNAAGHNGVQSIIDAINTKTFWRIRIGIGRDPKIGTETYVLQPFSTLEKLALRDILRRLPQELNKQFFN